MGDENGPTLSKYQNTAYMYCLHDDDLSRKYEQYRGCWRADANEL